MSRRERYDDSEAETITEEIGGIKLVSASPAGRLSKRKESDYRESHLNTNTGRSIIPGQLDDEHAAFRFVVFDPDITTVAVNECLDEI